MGSEIEARTHKGALYNAPGTISTKIVDLPTPQPKMGEVLIKLTHSGVCHSDLGVMMQTWDVLPAPTSPDQVGGHEGVGEVVSLGPGATEGNIKVGDRVGVKWVASVCNRCDACLESADGVCYGRTISGYGTPGTFQQYVVGPIDYVTPIPEGLDSAAAAPMLCAGVTMFAAVRQSGVTCGNWLVVSGAGGGLGHIGVQIAAKGFGIRVIGIDHPSKQQLVMDSGAEHFIDITKLDGPAIIAEVRQLTGGLGAHATIVVTANNNAYAQALDMLRFRGTLVCVGVPEGESIPIASAKPSSIIMSQLRITAVNVGNRKDAQEVLDLAARGIVKTVHTVEPLQNLTNIFKRMLEGQLQGRVVVSI
ncbi:hypothetical protein VE00_04311 [Pseudogymnoascus sp. WSF 3629]|nr:hypothetical protein VE00_04311 [Pseudogymnoascus sp. WSF 3629]